MKHTHEWELIFNPRNSFRRAVCKHCSKQMSDSEIERRLNGAERLSVRNALFVQTLIPEQFMEQILALRAYAHALEGK